jgi:hypothetical protein
MSTRSRGAGLQLEREPVFERHVPVAGGQLMQPGLRALQRPLGVALRLRQPGVLVDVADLGDVDLADPVGVQPGVELDVAHRPGEVGRRGHAGQQVLARGTVATSPVM